MDAQVLTDLFATTFSADPNARKAAEVEIKNVGWLAFGMLKYGLSAWNPPP